MKVSYPRSPGYEAKYLSTAVALHTLTSRTWLAWMHASRSTALVWDFTVRPSALRPFLSCGRYVPCGKGTKGVWIRLSERHRWHRSVERSTMLRVSPRWEKRLLARCHRGSKSGTTRIYSIVSYALPLQRDLPRCPRSTSSWRRNWWPRSGVGCDRNGHRRWPRRRFVGGSCLLRAGKPEAIRVAQQGMVCERVGHKRAPIPPHGCRTNEKMRSHAEWVKVSKIHTWYLRVEHALCYRRHPRLTTAVFQKGGDEDKISPAKVWKNYGILVRLWEWHDKN